MKLLFVMHHYAAKAFYPIINQQYFSARPEMAERRVLSLAECINSIWRTFGGATDTIYRNDQVSFKSLDVSNQIDVVVCVSEDKHIIDDLKISSDLYRLSPVEQKIDPLLLGFAAQKVIADASGKYDYYCHIEDDLVFSDPLFFDKLSWFNKNVNPYDLLQPNRMEIAGSKKCFIDGDAGCITKGFQNKGPVNFPLPFLTRRINFLKPDNPYAGSYFLNQSQLDKLLESGHYNQSSPDYSWIGPLESSMCLSLLKTFTLYKPSLDSGFLEIQHYGDRYCGKI